MRFVSVEPAAVDEAADVLIAGGLVVVPTDTVYGVAVRGALAGAVEVLAAAKGRPDDQPVALLVGSVEQACEVAEVTDRIRAVAEDHWPGPLTMVLPRRPTNDWDLGGRPGTVGVRWPDDAFVTDLARKVGPLAVTSANRHGAPTPRTARAAADLLRPVDLVVDGGPREGEPSTVVEMTEAGWVVLRPGAVSDSRLSELTGGP
jgi:tRNA threonylcarbamoyl adenosine modification protein (Sua5/YciO/YrdC/YwlC family)